MSVVLNQPATNPFDKVADIGVALRLFQIPGAAPWQHAGMLYKDGDEPARIFELRDHFDTKDDVASDEFRWVQASLPEVSRRLALHLTKKIVTRRDRIQFGFGFDGDFFTIDGEYLRQDTGKGLTCATLILAIFRRLGIEILKCDEWTSRPEDEAWQRDQAKRIGENQKFARLLGAKIAEHVGDPRFRPDEVAVGVASNPHPLSFKETLKLAPALARELEQSYKPAARRKGNR